MTIRSTVMAGVAYVVAYVALVLTMAATVGLDVSETAVAGPYALVCSLCAVITRKHVLLLVPLLHWFVVEPLYGELARPQGPFSISPVNGVLFLAGTGGVAAGLVARALLARGRAASMRR